MLFIKNGDAVSDFPPGANHLQLGKAELAMSQSYDELLTSLKGLAREMNALHQQSARALAPVVEQLIATRSRDVRQSEHRRQFALAAAHGRRQFGQAGRERVALA